MKVRGAGLPRTATTTLLIALEQLGFAPCYHMRDVLGDLEGQLPLWEAIAEGGRDWQGIFGDAQSTVDFPSSRYWRELLEAYPDAKVILSTRSPEGWVRSMRETVWGVFYGDSVLHYVSAARTVVDPLWNRYIKMMFEMNFHPDTGVMAGDTFDDDGLAEVMKRWDDSVKRDAPADQLLVWDPKEGWEPLCDFLEVDVPDEPLPRVNDTKAFQEGIIGGGLAVINEWWDQRERPQHGLHGAALE